MRDQLRQCRIEAESVGPGAADPTSPLRCALPKQQRLPPLRHNPRPCRAGRTVWAAPSVRRESTSSRTRGVYISRIQKKIPDNRTAQKTTLKRKYFPKRLLPRSSDSSSSSEHTGVNFTLRTCPPLRPPSAVTSAKAVLGNGKTYLALGRVGHTIRDKLKPCVSFSVALSVLFHAFLLLIIIKNYAAMQQTWSDEASLHNFWDLFPCCFLECRSVLSNQRLGDGHRVSPLNQW